MAKNFIPGLLKVDWTDTQRQSEFVNSVVSALNSLGEKLDYDYVCAISGSAFRTSFSMPSALKWNHGNYHVIHTPIIIEHTFKMLGYNVTQYIRGDYETDRRLIVDSIDKGIPVITLEGVINCSDACVISGYDNDGHLLLGIIHLCMLMKTMMKHRMILVISERPTGMTGFLRKEVKVESLLLKVDVENLPKKEFLKKPLISSDD